MKQPTILHHLCTKLMSTTNLSLTSQQAFLILLSINIINSQGDIHTYFFSSYSAINHFLGILFNLSHSLLPSTLILVPSEPIFHPYSILSLLTLYMAKQIYMGPAQPKNKTRLHTLTLFYSAYMLNILYIE